MVGMSSAEALVVTLDVGSSSVRTLLLDAQGRYWLASVLWDDERPGLTLPEKYIN